MKTVKFSLLLTALVSSFVLCFASSGWGTSYTKGRYTCEDFEEAERLYRSDSKNVNNQIYYAGCLVLNGKPHEGMFLMHNLADRYNHVFAALFIAEYIESGGDFELPVDVDKISEGIHAYGRVLAFVNFDPRYPLSEPIDYKIYENKNQMELRAYHRIPQLYNVKYILGFYGLYNKHLMTSVSYKGNRNLDEFSKYNPYTQDSLIQAIESANRCINLPKKRHFKTNYYEFYKKSCQIEKERALAIQPLEEKRLVLLATESCRRDLPNCKEYNEVHNQIETIMEQKASEINALSDAYDLTIF